MIYRKMLLAAGIAALLNTMGAQAQRPPGQGGPPPPITAPAMMSASIPCSDLQRSIDFYTKGLGLSARARVEMGKVIEVPIFFPGGGTYLLLQHPTEAGTSLPTRGSLNRIALMVPDLKALEARLKTEGYQFKGPINELPQYRVAVAFVEDPDGNQFELIQRMP